ncbi:MAG: FlgO family outer membrane protein [Elusimicrobia bacterium]|nr:FlgO family outer membrane protein [Elusimicrobiota bacterium]
MKRRGFLILGLLLAACGGPVRKDKMEDAFGRDPYEFLAERLSAACGKMQNKKVAVLPFSYTDRRESDDGVVVSERLITRMIQEDKLEVVERNLLEKVMGELKLQYSGGVDENSIKHLGKILGVEAVVTGTLTRQSGGTLEINARVIRTETAGILSASSARVPLDWETLSAEPAPVSQQDSAVARPPVLRPSAEAVFPAAWKYRENFRIAERSGASLVDYQALVKFDSSVPIRLGRMKADCSDLRFANSDEKTGLNYWLESGCGTGETRVWVRFPFLAKNSVKNFYMYYGNNGAVSESSGDRTFLLFDDFDDGVLDQSKWRKIVGDSPMREANGELEFEGSRLGSPSLRSWIATVRQLPHTFVMDVDALSPRLSANGQMHEIALRWDGSTGGGYGNTVNALLATFFDGNADVEGAYLGEMVRSEYQRHVELKIQFKANEINRYSIHDSGNAIELYWNDTLKGRFDSEYSPGNSVGLSAREYPPGEPAYFDNLRIRTWAAVEPKVYGYRPG